MRSLAESRQAFATLELAVHRRLAGQLSGGHQGVGLGPGTEPEEVARYRPGEDDVRRIDWNVSARTGETHVWRTRAEHEVDTWVLVDESASMDFGTVDVEKGDLAAWVTGAVGLLSDAPGNRMGVLHLTGEGLQWSPALSPRHAAVRAMSTTGRDGRRAPRSGGGSTTGSRPTLADGLTALDARHRRQGVRVVVSDFVEPDGAVERPFAWEKALRRLSTRHDVLVVEVVDPRELALPDVGPVVLVDPETGHRCEVWTSSPKIREQYAELAAAHRRAVAAAVRASGAEHLVLRTDRDWVLDLARFVRGRRRARPRRGAR
jgi:uncharacterized protein (DUF58 family)